MVIVRLAGGLGNQLFQYATARRITEVNHDTLKLDISSFKSDKLRVYELNHFNIKEEFALPEEIIRLRKGGWLNKFLNHFRKEPHYPKSLVKECHYQFDPAILNLSGDIYLDGYWQSEKYYSDISKVIQKEFTIKTKPDKINEELAEMINKSNSVSLHIRRTDYVTDINSSQVFETCPLNYYQKAIHEITQRVIQPNFFVFSDDIFWAKQNLRIDFPTFFVDHNGPLGAYEDLRLLSQCKHHIIANSTFSWWGAWLSQNQDKIIIAPKRWFMNNGKTTKDLIPEKWIKV